LFIFGQDDEGRKTQLGAHGNDVFLPVADTTGSVCGQHGKREEQGSCDRNEQTTKHRNSPYGNSATVFPRADQPKTVCARRAKRSRLRQTGASRRGSRSRSGQHVESLLEAVGVKGFFALSVVVRVIGIEPVASRIDVKVRDFGKLGGFEQELLLRDEGGDEL